METIGNFVEEQQERVRKAVCNSVEYQGFTHCIIGALTGHIECNGSIDIAKSVIKESADWVINNSHAGMHA